MMCPCLSVAKCPILFAANFIAIKKGIRGQRNFIFFKRAVEISFVVWYQLIYLENGEMLKWIESELAFPVFLKK